MPKSVEDRFVLFWCLYCTKLAPISNPNTNAGRAERAVMLYQIVRIRVAANVNQRLGCGHPPASNSQKFSCLKRKAKGGVGEVAKNMKENFGVANLTSTHDQLPTHPQSV